jgi:hypothetical protein
MEEDGTERTVPGVSPVSHQFLKQSIDKAGD